MLLLMSLLIIINGYYYSKKKKKRKKIWITQFFFHITFNVFAISLNFSYAIVRDMPLMSTRSCNLVTSFFFILHRDCRMTSSKKRNTFGSSWTTGLDISYVLREYFHLFQAKPFPIIFKMFLQLGRKWIILNKENILLTNTNNFRIS